MKTIRRLGAAVLLVAAGAAGWIAWNGERTEPPTGTASAASPAPAQDPSEVTIGQEVARQIRVGTPEWREVAVTMSVPGRVEADETRLSRAGSPVGGRITELRGVEGQLVTRGQTLAAVRSTELSEVQLNLLKAHSQAQLAERSVARARQVLAAGVISAAELQRREAEHAQAVAELAASRDRLRVLGMSDEAIAGVEATRSIHSTSLVVASIDGVILERHATPGQVVQAADPLFVIADLSQVWVVADVPEQNAGKIRTGKSLEADIPAVPGRVFRGTLSFVSAAVNPETHSVRVRMDVPNPGGMLKPAMLANVRLHDSPERRLTVPSTAVVREGNSDVVFVELAPNRFAMQTVMAGGTFEGRRVILSGIEEGRRIVVDGGFHLNNERKRASLHAE